MTEATIHVPALEKLVDYAASGLGSMAGHLFAGRIARREAEARLIAAEGEVQVQRILAEGQANTMQVIAKAQAEARSTLVSPDAEIQGQIAFGGLITQRLQFQEEKRQANLGSVLRQAALELGDREVPDHEVDHDWTARFFNDVQDVSSEEMQQLWSSVLAGEVERPGSTTIKTLGVLKNLDKVTASLFRKLCSTCVSIRPDGKSFSDARVPSLDGDAAQNGLQKYGLGFGNLNVLNEHGLIISEYDSWVDIQALIGFALEDQHVAYRPVHFQGKYWVLNSTIQRATGKEFRLSGVALTKSGQELSRAVDLEPADEYVIDLTKYFETNNLEMIEVPSWEPRIIPSSTP